MGFVLRDLLQVAAAAYALTVVLPLVEFSSALTSIAWLVYWYFQGMNFTALWVLAHECGHQAFSPSRTVNDTMGMILHSALLVPYHSWRISHGNHHKHTNHIEKDTVFVPPVRDSVFTECVKESPVGNALGILLMWFAGWPGYLLFNFSGQKYSRTANHFDPSSPLFRAPDKMDVIVSDLGIIAVVSVLALANYIYGCTAVFLWYGAPYLMNNLMLVTITFLQHTDSRVPHYPASSWNFVRGALCTVDRDYGIFNGWLHHITDSHVVHHLFSTMPHYNAIIATKFVKEALGSRYTYDNSPVIVSVWKSWRDCRYVVRGEEVANFRR